MNLPAASGGVSKKGFSDLIVASDGVFDPQLRNKICDKSIIFSMFNHFSHQFED
jgi:hypothetical protein